MKTAKLKPVQQIVYDEIMQAMASGVVPWRSQYSGGVMPYNGISKKEYQGLNVLLLALRPFPSAEFLTFKQINDLGGQVLAGAKSSIVTFYKTYKQNSKESGDQMDIFGGSPAREPGEICSKDRMTWVLRYYRVFNVSQTTLWTKEKQEESKLTPQTDNEIDVRCKGIVGSMPNAPSIDYSEMFHPCYIPGMDAVRMPKKEQYESREAFYSTLFHELTHSTGHPSRLDRFSSFETAAAFGSQDYSQEELVAEIGAAFLAGKAGILQPQIDNIASYLAGWSRKLKHDPKALFTAATAAQRAFDFITQTK